MRNVADWGKKLPSSIVWYDEPLAGGSDAVAAGEGFFVQFTRPSPGLRAQPSPSRLEVVQFFRHPPACGRVGRGSGRGGFFVQFTRPSPGLRARLPEGKSDDVWSKSCTAF